VTWNINLNTPARSLIGILLLFEDPAYGAMGPAFARNSEFYYNPLITKVQVTVEGVPNQLYTQGTHPHHHWEEIVKEFGREDTYRSSTNMFTTYFQSPVARFQEQRRPQTAGLGPPGGERLRGDYSPARKNELRHPDHGYYRDASKSFLSYAPPGRGTALTWSVRGSGEGTTRRAFSSWTRERGYTIACGLSSESPQTHPRCT